MPYATRDDIFQLGLSAVAFVTHPRRPESYGTSDVDPTTGTIRLVGNGFSADDLVYFTVTSGGALPGGAAALTYYSPIPLGGDLFRLSATPGGAALTFSSAGSGWAIAIDAMRRLDKHLADAAAIIDEHLTAHEPPILPDPITGRYPPVLVGLNARMAARRAVTTLQFENAAFRVAVDRLEAMAAFDGDTVPPAQPGSLLGDWKAGKPVQPRPVDQNEVADNAALAVAGTPVPWLSGYI